MIAAKVIFCRKWRVWVVGLRNPDKKIKIVKRLTDFRFENSQEPCLLNIIIVILSVKEIDSSLRSE